MAASAFPRWLLGGTVAVLLAGCTGGGAPAHHAAALSPRTPTTNAAGATAQYFGGTVTANPKVYVVWWGDPSKINSSLTAAKGGIADFFAGVTNSAYMDWLNEYDTNIPVQAGSKKGSAGSGQLIGRGNYVASLTLSNIPSGDVTDQQIQQALDAAFDAGTLPEPDDNTLYAVYFPPGVTINLDGDPSCSTYGAYHEAIIETKRHDAYYLVMPDCGSSFNTRCSVSSHELIEAMTDNIPTPASSPDYPQAWNDAMGNEMGDLCGSSGTVTTPLGTFTVQNIWDERTKACKGFSSDANDFNVSLSPNAAMVALNAPSTFTVQTATSAGSAQMLTLSAVAPSGVTATVSPTTIMSGATATLTVTAKSPSAQTGLQVVVRADATSGSTVQTHTAALLLSTDAAPPDLGPPPADLGGTADLANPGIGDGTPDDLALGTGVGGNQQQPGSGKSGCAITPGSAEPSWPAALLLFALGLLAVRRRA